MTVRGWKLDQFLKDRRAASLLEEVDDAPAPTRLMEAASHTAYVTGDSAGTTKTARNPGIGPVPAALLSSAPWHFGVRAFRQHRR